MENTVTIRAGIMAVVRKGFRDADRLKRAARVKLALGMLPEPELEKLENILRRNDQLLEALER